MAYYNSPRWTGEVADCSMPMTFDTYSNCSFGCMYCFAQFQRGIGAAAANYADKSEVRAVNVEKIKRMFTDPDNHAGTFANYIKQRRVMQWGGMSDQFDGYERKYGKTLELLKFFKEIDYPLCFSTKATWFTEDERYMSLIRGQKNWNFKFSIITENADHAKAIERGVPSPQARLKAIEAIAKADAGGATLRLRPFIVGVSNLTYTSLIRHAAECGATALSTEFFCVEQRSKTLKQFMPIINQIAGFDIMAFYKKYSVGTGYLRLNRKVKEPFFRKMQEVCKEVGMRYYVSDAHFKELCNNGSCCGLPESWNYSRGQWCEALQIAKKKGFVVWDDVQPEVQKIMDGVSMKATQLCQSSAHRAHFYGMSMERYMNWLWNNPQHGQSPYKLFECALVPNGTDAKGNLIYLYKGAK